MGGGKGKVGKWGSGNMESGKWNLERGTWNVESEPETLNVKRGT